MRVAHLGHVEVRTPKLEESLLFFKNVLGLEETERDGRTVYLRAWGDWEHHTLVLTEAERPGVEHVAYRVAAPDDVEAYARRVEASGYPVHWIEGGTEAGQGRCDSLLISRRPHPGAVLRCPEVPAWRALPAQERAAEVTVSRHQRAPLRPCQSTCA